MRDEALALFVEEIGEPTSHVEVPESIADVWRDRLPQRLIEYWRTEGWTSFGNGLVWTVDPAAYEDIIDEWLSDTPLEQQDSYHVFARSAFGDLFACGERSGCNLTIACSIHTITGVRAEIDQKSPKALDDTIEAFFATSDRSRFDLRSQDDGEWLFQAARRTLGDLDDSTMFGFEPALVAGGHMNLSSLRRIALDPHLTLLRQLAPPRLVLV
jgi:hypothetical protein